jgi:CheY-like chemotaxis protein
MSKVLIADDSPSMRTLLRMTLRGGDFDVVEARDGDEAVALLATHRPTVAILDVNMPGRTGLEVCRAVRADPGLARTGVVVISANGLESDARAALAAGADQFLSKPFSPRQLIDAVARLAIGRPAASRDDRTPIGRS